MCLFGVKAPTLLSQISGHFFHPLLSIVFNLSDVAGNALLTSEAGDESTKTVAAEVLAVTAAEGIIA